MSRRNRLDSRREPAQQTRSRRNAVHRREATRLDKWLWAARFYKTRSLAKAAIDGGKVHLNGSRAKAAKEVAIGDTLAVSRGEVVQTVVVAAIAEQRGSATIAATLYAETEDSIDRREASRAERRMQRAGLAAPPRRPDKRQRRRLRDFKNAPSD